MDSNSKISLLHKIPLVSSIGPSTVDGWDIEEWMDRFIVELDGWLIDEWTDGFMNGWMKDW